MNLMHCVVCNDIKHFEHKVDDANRISRFIEQTLSKYEEVDTNLHSPNVDFRFDSQHQHFMCGTCYKANTQMLRNAEDKINNNLLKFCVLICEDKASDSDYYQILRNLGGHYPGKYHALERFWNENKRK